jgi:hypothetical protein
MRHGRRKLLSDWLTLSRDDPQRTPIDANATAWQREFHPVHHSSERTGCRYHLHFCWPVRSIPRRQTPEFRLHLNSLHGFETCHIQLVRLLLVVSSQ